MDSFIVYIINHNQLKIKIKPQWVALAPDMLNIIDISCAKYFFKNLLDRLIEGSPEPLSSSIC